MACLIIVCLLKAMMYNKNTVDEKTERSSSKNVKNMMVLIELRLRIQNISLNGYFSIYYSYTVTIYATYTVVYFN